MVNWITDTAAKSNDAIGIDPDFPMLPGIGYIEKAIGLTGLKQRARQAANSWMQDRIDTAGDYYFPSWWGNTRDSINFQNKNVRAGLTVATVIAAVCGAAALSRTAAVGAEAGVAAGGLQTGAALSEEQLIRAAVSRSPRLIQNVQPSFKGVPSGPIVTADLNAALDEIYMNPLGGRTFHNYEGKLPIGVKYTEHDVLTPGTSGRGAMRLVVGNDGSIHFTESHYFLDFLRIDEVVP